jgi:agmatinase
MAIRFIPPDPPFMGSRAGDPATPLEADAVVFGAPHGTPYAGVDNRVHEGTPGALRRAPEPFVDWVDHYNFDVGGTIVGDRGFRLTDLGDLPTSRSDGPGNRALIESATRSILAAGAVPIMIGGDDSTPIPFLAAFSEPITIVQVDAHIDWREERYGEPLGFSSTMRRASEMPHVERIVQVGMRNFGSARLPEVEDARAWGATLVTARAVHRDGIGPVLDLIPPRSRVVVTFDCDALDASAMPAVMAPSPGGLTYDQVTGLVTGIVDRATLAGFDLIEFVPERDRNGVFAFTAASLLLHVVGTLANRR